MNPQTLKFPIGTYIPNKRPSIALLEKRIVEIETFPTKLESLIKETTLIN